MTAVAGGCGPACGPSFRSLGGRLVLVPRDAASGARIASEIQSLGGQAVHVSLIEQRPPRDPAPLERAVERLNAGHYGWVAVTSASGADALVAAGAVPGPAGRGARFAAVGPATAERLQNAGFRVEVMPVEFTGARLAEELAATIAGALGARDTAEQSREARVLLPLSDIAEPTVEARLLTAGLSPERVTAYRTVSVGPDDRAAPGDIASGERLGDAAISERLGAGPSAALVLSSSGARALAARFAPLPPTTLVAAIGEPTAKELARLGIPPAVVASEHTALGTVRALAEHCAAIDAGLAPQDFTDSHNTPEGFEV